MYVNGTFKLSGAPEITGNKKGATVDNGALTGGVEQNVYLPSGKTVTVEDPLSEDASIGVTAEAKPEVVDLVTITNGLQGNGQPSAFTGDEGYTVGWNGAGTETVLSLVIAATVTPYSADYDGKAHTASGFTATADTALYDVNKGFTFSGKAEASRTDAGTTNMGLTASQFTNTNANFSKVTFSVTDGWQAVTPIEATVTITGATNTADYDGQAHAVSGYTAKVDTALYDVNKDFTFSGKASASRTDAGSTPMGLAASQFKEIPHNARGALTAEFQPPAAC